MPIEIWAAIVFGGVILVVVSICIYQTIEASKERKKQEAERKARLLPGLPMRTELRARVEEIMAGPLLLIEQQEFKWVDSYVEQELHFMRGSKKLFTDAVQFWLMNLRFTYEAAGEDFRKYHKTRQNYFDTVLKEDYTLCQEINFDEYVRAVQYYSFIANGDFIPHGDVQRVWKIQDGAAEEFLVETDCEFVAFCWYLYD